MRKWQEMEYTPGNVVTVGKVKYSDDVIVIDTECSNIYKIGNEIHAWGEEGVNYSKAEKMGLCYIWMIGINGEVYYGRTIEELQECFSIMMKSIKKIHVDIFIQNLSYDFQPLRNAFDFTNVFARDSRKVIRCNVNGTNVRIRDSYALSQMSLDEICNVYDIKNKKLTGTYDYNKIRTPDTELTRSELLYCENDCLSLMEYISIERSKYGSIRNIPDTHTGKVRKMFKDVIKAEHSGNEAFAMKDWKKKIAKMHNTPAVFKMLCKAFMGGTVGVNFTKKDTFVKNITSYDLKSAYIYEILKQKYPCTRFYECDTSEYRYSDNDAYLMRVKLKNVYCKGYFRYISLCKCISFSGVSCADGKVVSADEIELVLTDVDFEQIKQSYRIEEVEIVELYKSRKSRLPKEIVILIISLYNEKERIAKEKGSESSEYTSIKRLLNAVYGMMVTNYIVDECNYDGEWTKETLDEDTVDKKVEAICGNEILPYQWGVWVTAYTRAVLWGAIRHFGKNCVYVDTDCVKVSVADDEYISEFNASKDELINEIKRLYGIDASSIKGIGYFKKEYVADEFRAVSAKRYAYKVDGEIHVHISGVSEGVSKHLGDSVNGLYAGREFSEDECGRKNRFFNDFQCKLEINGKEYYQKYGVCIMPIGYKISGKNEDISHPTSAVLC